jgi:enoyl-CoA hydratase/carnithine racemase
MPAYRTVLFAVDRGVATITLNRPRQRNAIGDGMRDEPAEAYRACDRDDSLRVIVLTGTPPAFCAGADLGSGEQTFAEPGPGFSAAGIAVPAWSLSKPVIAAVNGHAIGLGLTLALQCDIRFFAADARYGVVPCSWDWAAGCSTPVMFSLPPWNSLTTSSRTPRRCRWRPASGCCGIRSTWTARPSATARPRSTGMSCATTTPRKGCARTWTVAR